MSSLEIATIVRQCKNLKSLSVVGCGLRFQNVIAILANSQKLEEFAWDTQEVLSHFCPRYPSIRRLHLFCNIQKVTLFTIAFARNAFPNFEHIWIHFAPDSVSVLPLTGMWMWSSCVTYGRLSRQCLLTINNLQFNHVTDISTLISFMNRTQKEDDEDSGKIFNLINCLKLKLKIILTSFIIYSDLIYQFILHITSHLIVK